MMLRRISILGSLILILALAGVVWVYGMPQAQPQPQPQSQPQQSDPIWQATYWNNQTLSGSPALVRSETDINYDWGRASPAPSVNADRFSVRWTRYIDLTPETYRFTAAGDDGIRVWVDNVLIINQL
jgi:mannan endo-1,4-beta-mannosidase